VEGGEFGAASGSGELRRARAAVEELQRCVAAMSAVWGDSVAVRRLCTDARRAGEDLDEIGDPAPAVPQAPARTLEVVPDADYAPGFFSDSDDEGLGHPRG
jgi:hypothetical protein